MLLDYPIGLVTSIGVYGFTIILAQLQIERNQYDWNDISEQFRPQRRLQQYIVVGGVIVFLALIICLA